MRHRWLLALLLCGGCMVKLGPGPDTYEPAASANGIRASLALSSSALEGELLEVREDGIVVLTTDQVAMIPFDAITSSAFRSTNVALANKRMPTFEERRKLQLLSRYPQGIPAVALQKLLASKTQASVAVIR